MNSRIIGILSLCVLLSSCSYKRPVELRKKASESIESMKKSNPDFPNLKEAEALFQFGDDSEQKKEFGPATRAYKDIIAMLQKELPHDFEYEQDKTAASGPNKFVEPPAFRLPRPIKVKKLKKENRFPEARNIDDLKKEGIADFTKVTPQDEARQRSTALLFKEKFPGVIAYSFGEPEFQTSSMSTLEKISTKLKADPRATIIFQAQMGQGEEFGLMDERFELLQTFFQEKGINSDRVAMDDKRIAGDWPEIRIFILH